MYANLKTSMQETSEIIIYNQMKIQKISRGARCQDSKKRRRWEEVSS